MYTASITLINRRDEAKNELTPTQICVDGWINFLRRDLSICLCTLCITLLEIWKLITHACTYAKNSLLLLITVNSFCILEINLRNKSL